MPLNLIVDDLETVAEAFRGEYTEKDGKFHLNVEGVEDTSGLKSALQKERGSRGALEKQMKAWSGLGKTPEEIAELLQKQADEEAERAKKSGDFASIMKQKQDAWEKEKADLAAERDVARSSERSAVIGERLLGALTKAGVTESGARLLPEQLSKRIHFETVDGNRVLKIMQADGVTPLAGKGADGTATIDDLVAEAITSFPELFKGSGAGGSGKPPHNGSGGSGVSKKSDLKTEKERAAFVDKFGFPAYQALSD